jgi:Ca2+ transporting ATPase
MSKYADNCGSDVKTVLKELNTDASKGLTTEGVAAATELYGKNELPEEEGETFWQKFVEQFDDPLVKILMAAAGVSTFLAFFEDDEEHMLTAYAEPIVILVILIANAYVGAYQEMSAESAIDALKKYSAHQAKVIRNGKEETTINAVDLVPGDIVSVAAGDQVPADIRVIELLSTQLKLDQSIVTGEANTVNKDTDVVKKKDTVLQDKTNTMFSGTNVTVGKARGVVVGTGMGTEIGKIQDELNDKAKKTAELEVAQEAVKTATGAAKEKLEKKISNLEEALDDKTPLGKKIAEFGEHLCNAIMVICIVVWAINIGNFKIAGGGSYLKGAMYYFKIAVALAVAAIPEGLPAVITTCLALGTRRMAKKNALVRQLPSVETLGCTSVICSDKTGTLTTNMMSVTDFFVMKSTTEVEFFEVEGDSFAPIGGVSPSPKDSANFAAIAELNAVCSMCNDATLNYDDESEAYSKIGEPTEAALLVLGEKINAVGAAKGGEKTTQFATAVRSEVEKEYTKNFTCEFSRDRKSMSVFVTKADKSTKIFVKGASEKILERCDFVRVGTKTEKLTPAMRKMILAEINHYATGEKTLRCLGLAVVDKAGTEKDAVATSKDDGGALALESKMTFLGVAGMIDPPRQEVAPCIQDCKNAGIRVIMITGDNIDTATAIAKRIGILEDEAPEGHAFEGAKFQNMSEEDQYKACENARIFARVEPKHKSAIVEILQRQGHIVAMTGDGVNDAPALKKADIGIAMGTGTEVAKSASAMILKDDNFATIVHAVEEGRAIYNNTKQFMRYLISSNIGEVASIFITAAMGLPEALIPVQLLWVNLVTDGLPATALGFNPPDLDIMEKKPRNASDGLINGWLFFRYMVIGLYVGVATVAGSYWWFVFSPEGPMVSHAQLTGFLACKPDDADGSYNQNEFIGSNAAFYTDPNMSHISYVDKSPCAVFADWTPMTMALTILVMIELLNALNSVSEDQSMLAMSPFSNMFLIAADLLSLSLHFVILYVPFFAAIFQLVPLNTLEWSWVMYLSLPVILTDEVLKLYARVFINSKEHAKKVQ